MPDNHHSYLTFPEHMDLDDALTELGLEINPTPGFFVCAYRVRGKNVFENF